MKAVEPLVESAHDVGEIIHKVTSSVKRTALQKNKSKTIHAQESKPV